MSRTATATAGNTGRKEATMATTHSTTVSPVGEPVAFGGGTYELRCTCGEHVRYQGEQFTQVEAQRHLAWHAKVGR